MIKNVYWASFKAFLIPSDYNKQNFSKDFRKILKKNEISRKCVQWEHSYSVRTYARTDGQTC